MIRWIRQITSIVFFSCWTKFVVVEQQRRINRNSCRMNSKTKPILIRIQRAKLNDFIRMTKNFPRLNKRKRFRRFFGRIFPLFFNKLVRSMLKFSHQNLKPLVQIKDETFDWQRSIHRSNTNLISTKINEVNLCFALFSMWKRTNLTRFDDFHHRLNCCETKWNRLMSTKRKNLR